MLDVKEIYIRDLCEEFVYNFAFPIFRENVVYAGIYLLRISIACPLISQNVLLRLLKRHVHIQLLMVQ
nr:argininosuccinate synthase domain-containing protein [Bartonella sp. WD16.2]